jgi:hypothetical protein
LVGQRRSIGHVLHAQLVVPVVVEQLQHRTQDVVAALLGDPSPSCHGVTIQREGKFLEEFLSVTLTFV